MGLGHPNEQGATLAIIFAFNVMLARKSEIDSKYPGGLTQFRVDWLEKPRERWCEDQHLLAFSSMGSYFKAVYEGLLECGVDVLVASELTPPDEVVSRWNWLAFDTEKCPRELPGHGVMFLEIPRYWLKGEQPGETADFSRHPNKPLKSDAKH